MKKTKISIAVKITIVTVLLIAASVLAVFQVCYDAEMEQERTMYGVMTSLRIVLDPEHFGEEVLRSVRAEGKDSAYYETLMEGLNAFPDYGHIIGAAFVCPEDGELVQIAGTNDERPRISKREMDRLLQDMERVSGSHSDASDAVVSVHNASGTSGDGRRLNLDYVSLLNGDGSEVYGYLEVETDHEAMDQSLTSIFREKCVGLILIIMVLSTALMLLILWLLAVRPLKRITRGVSGFSGFSGAK